MPFINTANTLTAIYFSFIRRFDGPAEIAIGIILFFYSQIPFRPIQPEPEWTLRTHGTVCDRKIVECVRFSNTEEFAACADMGGQ